MSFEDVMLEASYDVNNIVYCDPPYIPTSETASFVAYSTSEFNIYHQKRLAALADYLRYKGVTTIISNSFCDLTKEVFNNADEFKIVTTTRSVSATASARGDEKEYIIIYNGVTNETGN